MAASANKAMIDLSPIIERAFNSVGKVSGKTSEKPRINAKVKIGSPNPGSKRASRAIGESTASSGRVGSSALEWIDCMVR